ncbi:MAG TPA: IS481 family transposase [Candidatus Binatia bacterium]|nr:IS481 family transposase [Candidatus Binatia bacterium]
MSVKSEPVSRLGQYHRLRDSQGPEAARELVRSVLDEQHGQVAATASILGITRPTVRRARDGVLEDGDRTPHNQPTKTTSALETVVLAERKSTGYGRKRLARHLKQTKGLGLSPDTIGNILSRHPVQKQVYTRPSVSKPLYDYEALLPFSELQIDVKYIEDYGALGKIAFIPRRYGLPLYQWTVIDAKTKTKFLAYSHKLSANYSLWLMQLTIWWLRTHGISCYIHFQADNGMEFAAGSKRKEALINEVLAYANASFTSIPAGKKYLQGIVERTHRTDDEEFYRPHLPRITTKEQFLVRAQRYQDTFNSLRQHWGRGMNGLTPLAKLDSCQVLTAARKIAFPVLAIDDLFSGVQALNNHATVQTATQLGGKDLSAHYRFFSRRFEALILKSIAFCQIPSGGT